MKMILLIVTFMFSLNMLSSESNTILKIQSKNFTLTENSIIKLETITKSFLETSDYKVFGEDKIKNKCGTETCILTLAKTLKIKNVVIIKLDKINEDIEFTFDLFDFSINKKYSLRSIYKGKLTNSNTLITFLLPELKELLSYKANDKENSSFNSLKKQKETYQEKKDIKKNINKNKNLKRRGIRERKNIGINASLGGSPSLGFTISLKAGL